MSEGDTETERECSDPDCGRVPEMPEEAVEVGDKFYCQVCWQWRMEEAGGNWGDA